MDCYSLLLVGEFNMAHNIAFLLIEMTYYARVICECSDITIQNWL